MKSSENVKIQCYMYEFVKTWCCMLLLRFKNNNGNNRSMGILENCTYKKRRV